MKRFLAASILAGLYAVGASASIIPPVGPGGATPQTTNESNAPGGDYADMLGASTNQLGSVVVGDTVIVGTLTPPNDLFDAFFFTIDDQTELVSATIVARTGPGGGPASFNAQLFDSAGVSVFSKTFQDMVTTDLITLSDVPLTAGVYNFGLSIAPSGTPLADNEVFGWRIESTVVSLQPSAIPLPAGLPLLLAGLGAFGWMQRRQPKG